MIREGSILSKSWFKNFEFSSKWIIFNWIPYSLNHLNEFLYYDSRAGIRLEMKK